MRTRPQFADLVLRRTPGGGGLAQHTGVVSETETLDELRALHRGGSAASTLGLAALFETMARGVWPERGANGAERRALWVYERHRGCRNCSCPPRSARPCRGPNCPATIVSVHQQPSEYCGGRCRYRASQHQLDLHDVAVRELLREHRAGLDEEELAAMLGLEIEQVRRAVERANRAAERISRRQRVDVSKYGGTSWRLALAE